MGLREISDWVDLDAGNECKQRRTRGDEIMPRIWIEAAIILQNDRFKVREDRIGLEMP
jgi:hypothetical protein